MSETNNPTESEQTPNPETTEAVATEVQETVESVRKKLRKHLRNQPRPQKSLKQLTTILTGLFQTETSQSTQKKSAKNIPLLMNRR